MERVHFGLERDPQILGRTPRSQSCARLDMVGTRGGETKKGARSRRASPPEEPLSLNAPPPMNADGLPDPDAPPYVALLVTGDWSVPPSIGQIEAGLTKNGSVQNRIWRIDIGAESAIVHVHPNDVSGCLGTICTPMGLQVRFASARVAVCARATTRRSAHMHAAAVPSPCHFC